MATFGRLAQSVSTLLLLSSVKGQFTPGPAPRCKDAEVQAGNIHLPHETYCELFYSCDAGLNRFTQVCGPGTLFDIYFGACVAPEWATCPVWDCTVPFNRFPALCSDEYFECRGFSYVKRYCPSGERFDYTIGHCSFTATTRDHQRCIRREPSSSGWTCYDLEDAEGNPCVYTTRVASIEINNRPCPWGTSFNQTACQCSVLSSECPTPDQTRLASVKVLDPKCTASFQLDFDQFPLVATSEKLGLAGSNVSLPYQFRTVGVRVVGGWGVFLTDPVSGSVAKCYNYFLGQGQLSAPWAMRTRLQLQNAGDTGQVQTDPITLLTNNYNDACNSTLTVTLAYSHGRFTLTINATGATDMGLDTSVTTSGETSGSIRMIGTNVLEIIVIFENGAASAQLVDKGPNGNSYTNNCVNVPATDDLGAYITTNRCGYTFGEGLNGRIDYFYIYEGCGDLSKVRACPAQ